MIPHRPDDPFAIGTYAEADPQTLYRSSELSRAEPHRAHLVGRRGHARSS
jgi:hypothetical protein